MSENILRQSCMSHPLIHVITNHVTMTDTVNMILAASASAICADDPLEVQEITAICDGLLLNIGTPSEKKREAMLLAGREANRRGIPVILDPVGAGASQYRKTILRELLSEVHFDCIRGNMSEMAALSGMDFASKGVEDAGSGAVLSCEEMMGLAKRLNTTLAVTGAVDYAVTADDIEYSQTGTELLKHITGSGCMLSGLTAACFAGYTKERDAEFVSSILSLYGLAAERAKKTMQCVGGGTASFRGYLIDEISRDSGVVNDRPFAPDDF